MMRNKLAEYLMVAVVGGSDDAMTLVGKLSEMGVFDETDEVPSSEGLHGRDVSSGVDGIGQD